MDSASASCNLTTITAILFVNVSLVQKRLPRDKFTLIIKYNTLPTSVGATVFVSPDVMAELQVHVCARLDVICDLDIDSTDFAAVESLLSGVKTRLQKSYQKSLILLSGQFCNVDLERLFFGL
jgi:hypothetical protein